MNQTRDVKKIMLKAKLFGTFSVNINDTPITFRSDKIRALLAYLLVESDKPHRRAFLASLLWGELPHKASLTNLRVSLNRLRQSLQVQGKPVDNLFTITRQTVQLNLNHVKHMVDVLRFENADHADIRSLQQVIPIAQGEFLAGLVISDCDAFESWRLFRAENWHRRLLNGLDKLATHCLEMGDVGMAQSYIQQQLALEPWLENAHRQMMRALLMAGQPQAALMQFQKCRQTLAAELGLSPSEETLALYHALKQPQARLMNAGEPAQKTDNIPAHTTTFIGRQSELDQVTHLLTQDTRLLSIVGMGGIGKTELAQQCGRMLARSRFEAVLWLSFDGVEGHKNPNDVFYQLILEHLSQIDGTVSQERKNFKKRVQASLSGRSFLLILDNFETIIGASSQILELLESLPHLRVLATSRRRLHLPSETVLYLKGMTISSDVTQIENGLSDSVKMFHYFGKQVNLNFSVDENNIAEIIEICQLVGSLPLALHLAAAWLRLLPLTEIRDLLKQDLTLLTAENSTSSPQHRKIETILNHTWLLLTEKAQEMLAQISFFHGSFSRKAVEAVIDETMSSLERLRIEAELVDKGLLQVLANRRMYLHPLIRQYAQKQLQQQTEIYSVISKRFVDYYAQLVEKHTPLATANQPKNHHILIIDADIHNISAAWWASLVTFDRPTNLKFLRGLIRYHLFSDQFKTGAYLFSQSITYLENHWLTMQIEHRDKIIWKSHLLAAYATCIHYLGKLDEADTVLRQSLALAQETGDPQTLLHVLHELIKNVGSGYLVDHRKWLDQLLELLNQFPNPEINLVLEYGNAAHARLTGEYALAKQYLLQCEKTCQIYDIKHGLSFAWLEFANLYIDTGQLEKVSPYLEKSLATVRQVLLSKNVIPRILSTFIKLGGITGNSHLIENYFAECQQNINLTEFPLVTGEIYQAFGWATFQQGNLEQGYQYMWDALGAFAQMSMPLHQADVLIHLGHADWQMGNQESALLHWQDALSLAIEHGSTPLSLAALGGYTQVLLVNKEYTTAESLISWLSNHPKLRYQDAQHLPKKPKMPESVLADQVCPTV